MNIHLRKFSFLIKEDDGCPDGDVALEKYHLQVSPGDEGYACQNSHFVLFRIAYNFGRNKVNGVCRDNKERESNRTY